MSHTVCSGAGKVLPEHLELQACLYVRQSSLRQVLENTESGRRQYDLRRQATALGWPAERIHVIDEDQGKSGAGSAGRSGFQELMARVAAGEVGLVLSLEISRLGRNSADLQRLFHVAALTNTLILDEAGVHDPSNGSDRLLIGIKGTVFEFELQSIRHRLLEGQRSKARRGELKLPLPVGLVYDAQDQVVLDPDRSVVEAVKLVFETFQRTGSAMQTVKWYRQQELALPSRPLRGDRELRWSVPNHSQVRRFLKNPRYAGCYAYGRTVSRQRPDGSLGYQRLPPEKWQVCLPKAHVGYFSWEQYVRNQETLRRNARSFGPSGTRQAAPRNGAALLQSQVLCGRCGERMKGRYRPARPGRGQKDARLYVCVRDTTVHGGKICQSMRGEGIDAAVAAFVIEAVSLENVALALAVEEQVREDFRQADRQRRNRIEALRHVADLARRRYFEVDPGNRLVAATLESEWNASLRGVEQAREDRARQARAFEAGLSDEQVAGVQALASDFGKAWNAPSTGNADRKRLLRCLIEDVTLTREGYRVRIEVRMRGGKALALDPVDLPRPMAQLRKTPAETVEALSTLLPAMTDAAAAKELNRRGCRSWNGKAFTQRKVTNLRISQGWPSHLELRREQLRAKGWQTAPELASKLEMKAQTLRAQARRGKRFQRKVIQVDKRIFTMYRPIRGSARDPDPRKGSHATGKD